jgi:hypothetical protein
VVFVLEQVYHVFELAVTFVSVSAIDGVSLGSAGFVLGVEFAHSSAGG